MSDEKKTHIVVTAKRVHDGAGGVYGAGLHFVDAEFAAACIENGTARRANAEDRKEATAEDAQAAA